MVDYLPTVGQVIIVIYTRVLDINIGVLGVKTGVLEVPVLRARAGKRFVLRLLWSWRLDPFVS